jgi:hypothetical protein
MSKAANDWALIVGVSRYREKRFGDLEGPERDARDFYAWVTSPKGGGITKKKQVRLILSPRHRATGSRAQGKAKPTVEQITDFFEELDRIAKSNAAKKRTGLSVGRRLYIYMSGHGFKPSDSETALLTANAQMDALHHLPGKAWASLFYKGLYFEEVLLFMDCCRPTVPKTPASEPILVIPPNPKYKDFGKCFFAFACTSGRLARERVMDDGKVRGVFTTALLEGLGGAAITDPNAKEVSTADLRNYLYNSVDSFTDPRNPAAKLRPVVEPSQNETIDFVIGKAAPKTFAVRVHLPAGSKGKTLNLRRGNLKVFRSHVADSRYWDLSLPIGFYGVEIIGGSVPMLDFEVKAVKATQHVRF